MQPLIRAIEEHIKEETHIRLNESTSNYMKQSERRDSQKLNSGLGEKYENDSSDSDDNSDNNDKEMESKLAEEKMKKEFQYYSRASHSSSSRMCGKRVKRPIVVLTPNRQRHHWTTEEIHQTENQYARGSTQNGVGLFRGGKLVTTGWRRLYQYWRWGGSGSPSGVVSV